MDLGDIIYLIIAVFFVILGFFNKSKAKQKNSSENQYPTGSSPFPVLPSIPMDEKKMKEVREKPLPPSPKVTFQSSMDLVACFEGQSSINESFAFSSPEFSYEETEEQQRVASYKSIKDLISADNVDELRKAMIYKEVFDRRF